MKYLPNFITWFRLLSAPVLALLFYTLPEQWRDGVTAAVFAVVTLTDWLDGYIARRFNITSRFGEFLDPVADKIVVVTALLILLDAGRAPMIAVLIIVSREICVLALREWMAAQGKIKALLPSLAGKHKTAFQMTAIALLLYHQELYGLPVAVIGQALLWIAVLLTVLSMLFYLRAALTAERQQDGDV